MYSLSSQIFEGITEYVLSESRETSEESESQKGPVGSGRVVGDILRSSQRVSERKYLHDYSYTLFEKHLEKELEKAKSAMGDRNRRAKLHHQAKALTNINKLAKEAGLQRDQKFLDDLSFLLSYGFQEQIEM